MILLTKVSHGECVVFVPKRHGGGGGRRKKNQRAVLSFLTFPIIYLKDRSMPLAHVIVRTAVEQT